MEKQTKNKTWRKVKLGEVADVQWGDTNTTKASYKPSGYLAYSATGPDGFMDHYDYDREGVILSAIGVNCGETWFAHGKWSSIKNTIIFWSKKEKANTKFLFYKTHDKRVWPIRGSAQPFISQADAREMEILIPEDIDQQKRIADILSAFDEKIELNNKINQTLEQIAQEIFKEWFVKFKFPGHEKVKLVDSELGKIPEGWAVKNIMEIIKRLPVGKRYDNKTALPKGKVPILDQGQSGIIGFHNEEPSVKASIKNPMAVFSNHTCYYRLITYDFSCIQNVIPYVGINGYPTLFVYYLTKDKIKMGDYKGHWPEFAAQKFIVPLPELARKFAEKIQPFIEIISKNKKENQTLSSLRDLLLPKLMNGEIRV